MRRYALRDEQWARIEPLLPGREGHVGVTAKDNRLFVAAVLCRYRAGIPWRDLPERFGDPIKVHTRFSRWAKSGVWEKVFKELAKDADNEYAMIDSTIVRAQPSFECGRMALVLADAARTSSHEARPVIVQLDANR